jgi:hypothetical protein
MKAMKKYEKVINYALMGLTLCFALVVSGSLFDVAAQKGGGRDPFGKPIVNPKKLQPKKLDVPVVITPPDVQVRIEAYKRLKAEKMQQGLPAPKPTTALLLSEIQVKGIFQTPRGYAAMIEAKPIGLSYTVYPGEEFFDGQLVAIEEGQLICRKSILWSDKRVEKKVEKLSLEHPDIRDQMTTARTGGSTADSNAKSSDPKSPEAAFTQMMELLQKLITSGQQQQQQSPEKKPN